MSADPFDDTWYDSDEDYFTMSAEDDLEEREREEERWTCLFPEHCCMPFLHTSDECHTAEMAEAMMQEMLREEQNQ